MNQRMTWIALGCAALLGACATAPTTTPGLSTARDTVSRAGSDPRVLENAPLELKRATEALDRANTASARGASIAEVDSAAYVAQQRAEAALALGQAKASEDAIKSAEADRERARADVKAAQARQAEAEAKGARAQATAAKAEASAAQAQAAEAQMQAATLEQQLQALKAQSTDRGTLVTLGDVLFEFGRAEIKPGAQDSLRKLAEYLKSQPERRIAIEGYTDSIGSDQVNLALSQRRADAVAAALSAMGVAPDRIVTRGYGKAYPVADNSTDTNRALNRRVEVTISRDNQPVRTRG